MSSHCLYCKSTTLSETFELCSTCDAFVCEECIQKGLVKSKYFRCDACIKSKKSRNSILDMMTEEEALKNEELVCEALREEWED